MTGPIDINSLSLVIYLIVPIIEFGILALLVLKIKMNLTNNMFVGSLLIGFLYLSLTIVAISKMFVPSIGTVGPESDIISIIRNSLSIGFLYLSFITSWFISQHMSKKSAKIIIFIGAGIIIAFILSYVANGIFTLLV